MRFEIARSKVWGWLWALLGATAERSVVKVDAEGVDITFGAFRQRLAFSELQDIGVWEREVPWYRSSIGWRTNFIDTVALLGMARNVVRLELKAPRLVWLLGWPVRCRFVKLSMQDPDAFVAAVASHLARGLRAS